MLIAGDRSAGVEHRAIHTLSSSSPMLLPQLWVVIEAGHARPRSWPVQLLIGVPAKRSLRRRQARRQRADGAARAPCGPPPSWQPLPEAPTHAGRMRGSAVSALLLCAVPLTRWQAPLRGLQGSSRQMGGGCAGQGRR